MTRSGSGPRAGRGGPSQPCASRGSRRSWSGAGRSSAAEASPAPAHERPAGATAPHREAEPMRAAAPPRRPAGGEVRRAPSRAAAPGPVRRSVEGGPRRRGRPGETEALGGRPPTAGPGSALHQGACRSFRARSSSPSGASSRPATGSSARRRGRRLRGVDERALARDPRPRRPLRERLRRGFGYGDVRAKSVEPPTSPTTSRTSRSGSRSRRRPAAASTPCSRRRATWTSG